MPATKAAEYTKAKVISVPAALGRSPSGRNKTDKRLPASSSRSMPQEVCNRDLPNHRVVRTQSLPGLHRSTSAYAGWNLVYGPYSARRPAGHFRRAGNHSHQLGRRATQHHRRPGYLPDRDGALGSAEGEGGTRADYVQ